MKEFKDNLPDMCISAYNNENDIYQDNFLDEDEALLQNETDEELYCKKMTDEEFFDFLEEEKLKDKLEKAINKVLNNKNK